MKIKYFNTFDKKESGYEISNFKKEAKTHQNLWRIIFTIIIICRLVSPIIILFKPIFGFILVTFFDWIDFSPFLANKFNIKAYHFYDKGLDFYSYIFMSIYFLASKTFFVFLILLIARLVGDLLFLKKNNRILFLFFPNLIEPLFLALLIQDHYQINFWLALIILVTLKLVQEYYLYWTEHVKPRTTITTITKGNKKFKYIVCATLERNCE